MGRKFWYIIGTVILIGILLALAWPAIQRELMREPVLDAVNAVRAGDPEALRNCFTGDAQVTYLDGSDLVTLPVAQVISALEPHMINGELRGLAQVAELANITMESNTIMRTDVTVTYYVDLGDENPYNFKTFPVRRTGSFELERTGIFQYKIYSISVTDREFRTRLQ